MLADYVLVGWERDEEMLQQNKKVVHATHERNVVGHLDLA